MENKPAAGTGPRAERDTSVRYEVHREREPGQRGAPRPPVVEEFYGLDRARIAALSYALDGSTIAGDRFTGTVRVFQVFSGGGRARAPSLVDVIDERVASRLLNEVRLPRADSLMVPVSSLQSAIDALHP